MNTRSIPLILLAGAFGATLAAHDAEARQRNGSGSFVTSGGKSGTYQRSVNRSPGSVNRHRSITTQDGRTYERSMARNYDKSTGAVNRSATRANGDTYTASGTYDKSTNTYERTITGPNGRQVQATTVYDRDTRSASSTYVGPNGKTVTGSTTYNPGNKGVDQTFTGPDGKVYTRSTANSYDPDTGTFRHSVTGPAGNTRTVDITPDKTP